MALKVGPADVKRQLFSVMKEFRKKQTQIMLSIVHGKEILSISTERICKENTP